MPSDSPCTLSTAFRYLCSILLVLANLLWMTLGITFLIIGVVLKTGLPAWTLPDGRTLAEHLQTLGQQLGIRLDAGEMARNMLAAVGPVDTVSLLLGAGLVLLALGGCCGMCWQRRCLLSVYLSVASAAFLTQLVFLLFWFGDSDALKNVAKSLMENSLRRYSGTGAENGESLLQNVVQVYVGCCGVQNGSDFNTLNTHWNRTYVQIQFRRAIVYNITYPITCCQFDLETMQLLDEACPVTNNRHSNHRVGCYAKIFQGIDRFFEYHHVLWILSAIVGIQALIILGVLMVFDNFTGIKNRIHPSDRS